MKKIISIVLCTVLFAAMLLGCSTESKPQEESPTTEPIAIPNDPPSISTPNFADGTYTTQAMGMYGPVSVSITIASDEITAIEARADSDTPLIANAAISDMTSKILSEQTLEVDTTSGATITSGAIISAVKAALNEAGGDMSAWTVKKAETPAASLPDEEFDIVIVGAGGAGLAAAIQASKMGGYSVLVLEKNAYTGGATALSGGGISIFNTKYNGTEGCASCTPEEYLDYFRYRTGLMDRRPDGAWINEDLVLRTATQGEEFYNYLIDNGIDDVTLGHGTIQYFDYEANKGIGLASGSASAVFSDFFGKLAEKNGAVIRTNSKVTGLLEKNGAVDGVVVETPQGSYSVRAKKVILTTGGYSSNRELFLEINADMENIETVWQSGASGATGDALAFTEPFNAAKSGYGFIIVPSGRAPYSLKTSIGWYLDYGIKFLVNSDGNRFTNESEWYYHKGFDILKQKDGKAFALTVEPTHLYDENGLIFWYYGAPFSFKEVYAQMEGLGLAYSADTIEELAQSIGVPAENLSATIQKYNQDAIAGEDTLFNNPTMVPLQEGPYYAFEVYNSVIASFYGFELDSNYRVLNEQGQPIENLYAAGECAFNNYYMQEYYVSTTAIANAVYGGSAAAEEAVNALNGQ